MCEEVPVYVLMGTCGCGKTTIAQNLVKLLNCPFIEGDLLHSKSNVEKMSKGIPLTDEDRWQWLESVRDSYVIKAKDILNDKKSKSRVVIATCSSLRKVYRDILRDVPLGVCRVTFIYLKGSYELIYSRMKSRKNHYMASNMLDSQWKILEEPDPLFESVIVQDISDETHVIAESLEKIILNQL
jgi:gluconokinase